jgi:hypothetical protein
LLRVEAIRKFGSKIGDVMKSKIILASAMCVVSLALSLSLRAQITQKASASPSATAKAAASPAASSAKQSIRPAPFHGMISAVDQNAKTFTLSGKKQSRVFKVTDKTSITKAGKPATMTDVTENKEASGSYWRNADGTLEAKTVKLEPIAKAKTSATSPAPSPKVSPEPKP